MCPNDASWSFRPFLVVAAFHITYSITYNLYAVVKINRTRKKKEKKLTKDPNGALMSLVCSRREQTKTNLYPGAFSPQQHRDHSEERARKYCETMRIETERENDN